MTSALCTGSSLCFRTNWGEQGCRAGERFNNKYLQATSEAWWRLPAHGVEDLFRILCLYAEKYRKIHPAIPSGRHQSPYFPFSRTTSPTIQPMSLRTIPQSPDLYDHMKRLKDLRQNRSVVSRCLEHPTRWVASKKLCTYRIRCCSYTFYFHTFIHSVPHKERNIVQYS